MFSRQLNFNEQVMRTNALLETQIEVLKSKVESNIKTLQNIDSKIKKGH